MFQFKATLVHDIAALYIIYQKLEVGPSIAAITRRANALTILFQAWMHVPPQNTRSYEHWEHQPFSYYTIYLGYTEIMHTSRTLLILEGQSRGDTRMSFSCMQVHLNPQYTEA